MRKFTLAGAILLALLVPSTVKAACPYVGNTSGTDSAAILLTLTDICAGGNVASGAADSGNPVKIGGKYNSTLPTFTNGQRGDAQIDAWGALRVRLSATQVTGADGVVNGGLSSAALSSEQGTAARPLTTAPSIFNGSTWDREFTCASSAVVNVSAAATTEIVALTASQVIRVCSFVLTGDTAATTATFVYGTGTNCGTGTTSLTGAMRMQDEGSISASAANGSLIRTASANALCLTAATGAVTGFVSYAKF